MSKIATKDFFRMEGVVEPVRTRVQVLERAGVDGAAYRDRGEGAPDSVLMTQTLCSTLALAESLLEDYADFVGSDQTIEDGLGNSHSDVMILDVVAIEQRELFAAMCTAADMPSAPRAMLTCRWVVRAT